MIFGTPKFSEQHHFHGLIPMITVGGTDVSLSFLLKTNCQLAGWKYRRMDARGMYWMVSHGHDQMRLRSGSFLVAVNEYRMWSRVYLPSFSLKGKTVLDAGAGCGETAHFFFENGAEKVISVENDPLSVSCLRENRDRNGWNVEILPESFSAKHFADLAFDFAKVDVEGAEESLLGLPTLPPCSIEVHSPKLTDAFMKKFAMKVVNVAWSGTFVPRRIGFSTVANPGFPLRRWEGSVNSDWHVHRESEGPQI